MKPYGQAEAEEELSQAFRDGDERRIDMLAAVVDRFDVARTYSIASAALWYARAGLHVFPLRHGLKEPHRGTHGCLEACSDPDTITAWWHRWPDSNVGIATGHLVDVIDVDGEPGVRAIAPQIDKVRERSVGLVSTPRAGGLHFYIPHVPGRRNHAGLIPGVDTRGAGGYVVAPPSVTAQGSYRWLRPLTLREES